MIKEKDRENSLGKMGEFMMACGRMENNTGRANSSQRTSKRDRVSGTMGEKFVGSPEVGLPLYFCQDLIMGIVFILEIQFL
jgi:hypothetical protein